MTKSYPQVEKGEVRRPPVLGDSRVGFGAAAVPAREPVALFRVDCSVCRRHFTFDVEAQWNALPEEMEVVGRRFLGIREDFPLCPECVGDVQVAGAERMYWALSQAL